VDGQQPFPEKKKKTEKKEILFQRKLHKTRPYYRSSKHIVAKEARKYDNNIHFLVQ